MFHEVIFTLSFSDFTVYVSRLFTLELSVNDESFFFEKEERSSETVVDNEGFKNILKFLNITGGYDSCKIGEFVWFIENVGGEMADRKVGDLVSEEGIELRDFLTISDMKAQMYWTSLQ